MKELNNFKDKYYAIEFCVMDGYDPYFEQSCAQYEVICANSAHKAEDIIRKKYFRYGNGSERSFRDVYFGRIQQFDNEAEAIDYAEEWYKKNKEDNQKAEAKRE